jgi:hypothetical protein
MTADGHGSSEGAEGWETLFHFPLHPSFSGPVLQMGWELAPPSPPPLITSEQKRKQETTQPDTLLLRSTQPLKLVPPVASSPSPAVKEGTPSS